MREQNLETVKTMIERGMVGDFEGIREFISPEFVATEADSLPYPGEFRGFEGYVALMTALASTWEGLAMEVHQLIADGDTVAIRGTLSGRRGDRSFSMPLVEIWQFREGKLMESQPYYFDTKLLADIYDAGGRAQAAG